MEPPPETMPHVREALEAMQQAGYRLGVICNTGMAGGRVLRQVLEHHGLLQYFAATVFSNQFGWSKPHPSIFFHTLWQLGEIPPNAALHVGDAEELDVEGARAAGLYSARYVPDASEDVATEADLVVKDWRKFGEQVAQFVTPDAPEK